MVWLTLFGIALAVIALVAVMIWNPVMRNRPISELPDVAHGVITRAENGGFRRVKIRGTDTWFTFERVSGDDESAVVALRIPRKPTVLDVQQRLTDQYAQHGFNCEIQDYNPSLLMKVIVPVDDIWTAGAGARITHAARLLIEALQVAADARIDIDVRGQLSPRVKNKIRQSI